MDQAVCLTSENLRIAARLWLPDQAVFARPYAAVVLCHGLGSRKERHADTAAYFSSQGFAVLAVDLRGHGESEGRLDGLEPLDIVAAIEYLRTRDDIDSSRLAVRGSSLGGSCAIHAAARCADIRAVVAICPAPEKSLLQLFGERGKPEIIDENGLYARVDVPAFLENLGKRDLCAAVAGVSPRGLFLIHAKGDEIIPHETSLALYERAGDPKELLLLEGGSHTSVQHDEGVNDRVVQWLRGCML